MDVSTAGCNASARPREILLPWIDFGAVAKESAFVEQAAITQDGDAALKALLTRVLNGSDRRRHALPPSLNAIKELLVAGFGMIGRSPMMTRSCCVGWCQLHDRFAATRAYKT